MSLETPHRLRRSLGWETDDADNPLGKGRRAAFWFFVAAAAVTVVAVGATLAPGVPDHDSTRGDVFVASVTGLLGSVVGFFIGQAAFSWQQARAQHEAAERRRTEEDRRAAEQALEGRRREADRQREDRRRRDDRIRAVLDDLTAAYNETKLVRRLVKAEVGPDPARWAIRPEPYAALRERLSRSQLAFEALYTRLELLQEYVPAVQHVRLSQEGDEPSTGPSGDGAADRLCGVEEFLNRVVSEYEKTRSQLEPGQRHALTAPRLERLRAFVTPRTFKAEVSRRVEGIRTVLERQLLVPVADRVPAAGPDDAP